MFGKLQKKPPRTERCFMATNKKTGVKKQVCIKIDPNKKRKSKKKG